VAVDIFLLTMKQTPGRNEKRRTEPAFDSVAWNSRTGSSPSPWRAGLARLRDLLQRRARVKSKSGGKAQELDHAHPMLAAFDRRHERLPAADLLRQPVIMLNREFSTWTKIYELHAVLGGTRMSCIPKAVIQDD
jgi:hypothetical protein